MRKKAGPTTFGIDLFGYSITGLGVTRGQDGSAQVVQAWERPLPLGAHIGNAVVALDAYDGVLRDIRRQDDAVVIGVYASTEGMVHAPVDAKTPGHVLQRGRAQMAATGSGGGIVGPEQHLMALPRPHDREQPWAELRFQVQPYGIMQVLDLAQAERPGTRPRVDARFLASIRAFLAFGCPTSDETLLFSHFDLLDSVHVVVHRRTVAYLYRRPKGLVQMATESAATKGEPLGAAVQALYDGRVSSIVREAFAKEMRGAVSAARSRIRGQKAGDGFLLSRLVLSGPLADVEGLGGTTIEGAGSAAIQCFRPVAELSADPAVRARAGRFTVALGHALNDSSSKHENLPVDLTGRVSLALLGRDRRNPLTVEERPLDALQHGLPTARDGGGIASRRSARLVYLAPVAVAVVLAARLVDGVRLQREVARLVADSARAQARVTEAQSDRTTLSERRVRQRALAAVATSRASAPMALDAAVPAIAATAREAWLSTVRRDGDLKVAYEGEALSAGALARFIEVLRAGPGFDRVELVQWEPVDGRWRFTVTAALTATTPAPSEPALSTLTPSSTP